MFLYAIATLILFYQPQEANNYSYTPPEPPTPEELVMQHFPHNYERMLVIANCESGKRQFDSNGNVIKSHTNDYGYFQINDASWKGTAEKLGLDYKNSVEDNIKMAKHIYEVQGINAWVCNRKV